MNKLYGALYALSFLNKDINPKNIPDEVLVMLGTYRALLTGYDLETEIQSLLLQYPENNSSIRKSIFEGIKNKTGLNIFDSSFLPVFIPFLHANLFLRDKIFKILDSLNLLTGDSAYFCYMLLNKLPLLYKETGKQPQISTVFTAMNAYTAESLCSSIINKYEILETGILNLLNQSKDINLIMFVGELYNKVHPEKRLMVEKTISKMLGEELFRKFIKNQNTYYKI